MESVTFKEIKDKAVCLNSIDPEDTYHKSYFYFVNYFSDKKVISEEDLVIGSNFAYGWMPTILNFKSDDFSLAVKILNKAKSQERVSSVDISILKGLINNSLVGVSKLLHFLNPEVYAIWDSRVCNFLTGKSYQYTVDNIDRFWSYLDLCKRITKDKRFANIHDNFIRNIGYQVSPMRTIEQIMFINSGNPIR